MKISTNWLSQYISLDHPLEELSDTLTQTGLEVEGIESLDSIPGALEGLLIGEVLTCDRHPNADKLSVTTVDIGREEPVHIVCGAPNVAAGQKVVVAPVNSTIHPTNGEPFKLKKAKIRGEVSEGMICAEDEIGLGSSHDGILVLDTDLPNGTALTELFPVTQDHIIEIGITPNRADALSHIGTARDVHAVYGDPITYPSVDDFRVDNQDLEIEVRVENTEACPRYSGLTLTNVTVEESPQWLKERLLAIGLTPINNVVDVTNFVLHELGQPMHAFDADEITGGAVVVRTMDEGTAFVTLDEKERKLGKDDLMICNTETGMCIAGVFGGIKSGVTEKTTRVFLESAYFSPDYVRRTATRHGLKTDASFRYERGTDPEITVYALKRCAMLLKEITGCNISSEIVDVYPEKIEPVEIPTEYSYIDKLIGEQLDRDTIHQILERLDIQLKDQTDQGFTAVVPTYRVDVVRPADIVEEVLRIYGFNNIALDETMGSEYLSDFPKVEPGRVQLQISRELAANGFYEIYTNSLTNPEVSETIDELDPSENVTILNKLSEELGVMRQTMLQSGLEVIAHNLNRRQNNLRFFEFGKIYRRKDSYKEYPVMSIFISGNNHDDSWLEKSKPVSYFDLSEAVSRVLGRLGIPSVKSNPISEGIFDYGASLDVGKHNIGRMGRIDPELCENAGIQQDVYYAELNWRWLLDHKETALTYQEISRFPEVKRDISLVVDQETPYQQIHEVALRYGNQLVRNIGVFDVYQGKSIEEGKKAYALNFTLQDKDKTLTDKIIDKTMNKLMKAFENELGAVIRK